MKRFSPLAAFVLLAGCGGGGGGGGASVAKFAGNYTGTYTVSTHGTLPTGFAPPSSGPATATVSGAGALQVDYGNSYVLSGTLHGDGSVTSGALSYPSPSGTQTAPAVVGWSQSSGQTTVLAAVQFAATSGSANFSTALTK